jgi:hypothetical protein
MANCFLNAVVFEKIPNFFVENDSKSPYIVIIGPWGRCYDHNFLRFLAIFCKKLAFFSKTNVMIKILYNLALF